MQQTGIHLNGKVSDFIINGQFQLPYCSNLCVRHFWSLIHNKHVPEARMIISWSSKVHSIGNVYITLACAATKPAAKWASIIWTRASVPRENIMLWKVISKVLLTKDILSNYGMSYCNLCVFCGLYTETIDHLYFECSAIHMLWNKMLTKSRVPASNHSSCIIWDLVYKATRWKTEEAMAENVGIKIYIDVIWRERNTIIFENSRRSMSSLWEEIRGRTYMQLKKNNSSFKFSWVA